MFGNNYTVIKKVSLSMAQWGLMSFHRLNIVFNARVLEILVYMEIASKDTNTSLVSNVTFSNNCFTWIDERTLNVFFLLLRIVAINRDWAYKGDLINDTTGCKDRPDLCIFGRPQNFWGRDYYQ